MTISGKEFKKLYPNTTFYRLTDESECHNGFQFNDGLNVDCFACDPPGERKYSGLYFTESNNIAPWMFHFCAAGYIGEVEILDDSLIQIEEHGFKADKFILKERCLIKDFSLWSDMNFCLMAVQKNGYALEYVKEQTNEICMAAVQRNGSALEYVKEQTNELCLLAVQQDGWALQFVKNQTEEICLTAVQQNGYALGFVKEQTKEICLAAVQQCGLALVLVKEQTKEICLSAVKRNVGALKYVKKQTYEIYLQAILQILQILLWYWFQFIKQIINIFKIRRGSN
jgi:hypothetical protein